MNVLEIQRFEPKQKAENAFPLVIEVPHGATSEHHYRSVERLLKSSLPKDLIEYYFVNTDVGAPETAVSLARYLVGEKPGLLDSGGGACVSSVTLLRGIVPRTFVDFNRNLEDTEGPLEGAMTPGLPPYIVHPQDRELLQDFHRQYTHTVSHLVADILSQGGFLLALHTYAPRSIAVTVDGDIVDALKEAYQAENWSRWPRRPDVDLLTSDIEGNMWSKPELTRRLRTRFEAQGRVVGENDTYALHPQTRAHHYATRWPGRTLCLEINRDWLADPFIPFQELTVSPRRVDEVSTTLARAFVDVYN